MNPNSFPIYFLFIKIEEQFNQTKADLLSQIEASNKTNEKLQLLDMKLTNDKKQFKEEKRRIKALRQEMAEIHNKHNAEISLKEEKIKELESNIAELSKKMASLEEESLFFISFDFLIFFEANVSIIEKFLNIFPLKLKPNTSFFFGKDKSISTKTLR